ncbi:protein NRT1/ PTR FAMILY 1.2-like isoform X1 [Coffea eugenioides]|uniref:Protein NRT1/ PTR FAMILY 1.2-like isoform X1 n=1 Tax=Coffea arabica TaxID=13443 RepID=A0A6P6TUS5_COFAR|nr:protein NRT1/ PTR FAMILY 1.2-like isoform X1 [Coffea arabica]XP_027182910.1 protein NRT1/ PTR FAMILY 1.2-like isoform X1 [Coffea eugenioides]
MVVGRESRSKYSTHIIAVEEVEVPTCMTENSADDEQESMTTKPLLNDDHDCFSAKGGFRTMPFILANEAFAQVASCGLQPSMILYLTGEYHLNMATGSNIIFLWSAATNFMPLLGAIVADSFLGRFRMILFGCVISLLGMALLWLTAMIPQVKPPPCHESNKSCSSATSFQLFLLCSCFGLTSIGLGGIRSSSLAFGADQLQKAGGHNNGRVLESYFSWYYALSTISLLIAYTCIVYAQESLGWQVGFGIPVMLMLLSTLSFSLASHLYVKLKAKSSLIVEMLQVAVASYRKRHIELSTESSKLLCHHHRGPSICLPSEKLRFLNKACIILDPEKDLTTDGTAADPWSLCTVNQVEDLKSILRVIPLWSAGMIMSVNNSQLSFSVLQAKSMNRKFGPNFEMPAGSCSMFAVVGAVLWIPFYLQIILPVASRILGRPVHLSTRERMGIGMALSFVGMIVAATVELKRRSLAIREGYSDDSDAVVDMSLLWLLPPSFLIGAGAIANMVAQNEFYYSEFPRSMSSISSTLSLLGISAANLVSSFLMNAIDKLSKLGGKESWISTNVNKGHYDYYYWVLAGLSMLNMIYFLICNKAYGPGKEDKKETTFHEQDD